MALDPQAALRATASVPRGVAALSAEGCVARLGACPAKTSKAA